MAPSMSSMPTVSIFTCGDISYFLRNRIEHIIPNAERLASTIPVVVVDSTGQDIITLCDIQTKLDEFQNSDDVYTPEFAEKAAFILLHETENPPRPNQELSDYLKGRPGSLIFQKKTEGAEWHEGPYFLINQELHQSWRVYPDNLNAFTSTVIPDDENNKRFVPFRGTSADGFALGVAVPSRLYFPRTSNKPLNGLRISIKDNFHLAGTVTTLGSLAWARLYGVQDSTSAYVQHLIELGLYDYVYKIGYNINMWDGYHNFAEFRETYEREYNEKPYISPTQTSKWEGGSKVTAEERAEAVRRRDIFSKWVHENVMGDSQDTVMVVWHGDLEPTYRDAVSSAPVRFRGSYNPNFFPVILGLPTAGIPGGHAPFLSRVTDRTEYLPATAGLVGGPGMDRVILKLSHDALSTAGFPTKVLPGRFAFKPEEKLRVTGRDMDTTE